MYSPSPFSCSNVPLCQIAAVKEKLLIFCIFVSDTTLDGHREKCLGFSVTGESQDGNPDCDFNLVLEKEVHCPLPLRKNWQAPAQGQTLLANVPTLEGLNQTYIKKNPKKPKTKKQ